MVNTDKLKGLLKEKRKTQGDCAKYIGIKTPTFNQKLNNIRPFLLSEAEKLQFFLGIKDVDFTEYFFYRSCCTEQQENAHSMHTSI